MLRNARHERFCQEVVGGQTLEKSYEIAGFKPSRKNAWAVRQRADISGRINELLAERQKQQTKILEKASEKSGITRADVMRRLLSLSEKAENAEQLGPAVRATELLGKEIGMFIERREQRNVDEFESMEERELRKLVQERARAVAVRDDEADETGTRH
jgi:phage terminase small subunit